MTARGVELLGRTQGLLRKMRDAAGPYASVRSAVADLLDELTEAALLPPAARPAQVVRATTDVGPMVLHADDRIITPELRAHGTWEADEAAFLRRRIEPGALVLDVGANVGYFTLLAARAVGPEGLVVAVEPEPGNVALLRANVWSNRLTNVVVAPVAAGAERGLIDLRMAEPGNTGSFETRADTSGGVVVPTLPLDELLADARVGVAKVDVQGGDHEAVAGMREAIGRSPAAVVLTEFWLEGMESRGIAPEAVLASYRGSARPLLLLGEGGTTAAADDRTILGTCAARPGRWVNLVLDAYEGARPAT